MLLNFGLELVRKLLSINEWTFRLCDDLEMGSAAACSLSWATYLSIYHTTLRLNWKTMLIAIIFILLPIYPLIKYKTEKLHVCSLHASEPGLERDYQHKWQRHFFHNDKKRRQILTCGMPDLESYPTYQTSAVQRRQFNRKDYIAARQLVEGVLLHPIGTSMLKNIIISICMQYYLCEFSATCLRHDTYLQKLIAQMTIRTTRKRAESVRVIKNAFYARHIRPAFQIYANQFSLKD